MITMILRRRGLHILLVIFSLILVSNLAFPVSRIESQITDDMQEQDINQLANVSPTINDWGIIGKPNESVVFTVWANVTDDDNDLANVTVHVNGPNTAINKIMPFNGTLNVTNLDAFIDYGIYDIYVTATDLANNTRVGRHIFVEIQADVTTLPDPNLTMPVVVVSSLIAGFIVFVVAYFYEKRRLQGAA
jgi:hypothetical protein